MITTAQAAAILGLSRSQTNRLGRALTRERHIIDGRCCWLYDEDEVRNLQRNRPARPRVTPATADQATAAPGQP